MSEVITRKALLELVDEWIRRGKRAAGPALVKPDLCLYVPLASADQLVLEGFVHPQNSIKEFFFPRTERIYTYRFKGHAIELADGEVTSAEQLILAARPCDAAAPVILDHVFNWDFKDKFYNERREATTMVTLACVAHDENCFCTSVGLGPAAEKGSDALLLPLGGDAYEVRCLTEKGKALFAGRTSPSDKTAKVADGPEKKFDVEAVAEFLKGNFEHPVWKEIALRCLGCGACAYTCPTCHCFDIVDEGTAAGGSRVKNWDSCQFGPFTLHASGHNPRPSQSQRQRQRIQHKFRVYPEKFSEVLCTGCGNCTRNCPVSLGVLSALEIVGAAAARDVSEVK